MTHYLWIPPGKAIQSKKFLFRPSRPERGLALYCGLPATGAAAVDKQGEADRTPAPVQTTRCFGVWKGFRREAAKITCTRKINLLDIPLIFNIIALFQKPGWRFVVRWLEVQLLSPDPSDAAPVRGATPGSGGVPERPKGADCKSAGEAYGGSNPPPSTSLASLTQWMNPSPGPFGRGRENGVKPVDCRK